MLAEPRSMVLVLMIAIAGCAAHQTATGPPVRTLPGSTHAKVACDCLSKTLDPLVGISCCIMRQPKQQMGEFLMAVYKNRQAVWWFKDLFNPDYHGRYVIAEGFNSRWFAIARDGFECTEVFVIDLEQKRLALRTGCWNAVYWGVAEFPSAAECHVTLGTPDGPPPRKFDLCGEVVDLSKMGR